MFYRYLAKFFLKRCGFLPSEIRRVFTRHLLRNISKGIKFCISSETLEDKEVILQDLKEICSSVEYNSEEDVYNCKR